MELTMGNAVSMAVPCRSSRELLAGGLCGIVTRGLAAIVLHEHLWASLACRASAPRDCSLDFDRTASGSWKRATERQDSGVHFLTRGRVR